MTEALAGSSRHIQVFRRRRRLRVGLVQLAYVAIGLALALALSSIRSGPQIDDARLAPVLVAFAGGLISFIALVFSLLFLVVQYGNTTLSPRLNLFRSNPLIWHAFGIFVGVFVFCASSAIALSGVATTTLLLPIVTIVLVVVSLAIMRRVQLEAFRSLQLGGALSDISTNGRAVLRALYHPQGHALPIDHAPMTTDLPVRATVTWPHVATVLRQIDIPRLLRWAVEQDVVVDLSVKPGDTLIQGRPVLHVRAAGAARGDHLHLLRCLETGLERTFDQDPLLAFRLLSDIGLRALSPAINDPATAVEALDHSESLLANIVDVGLGPRAISASSGDRPRVLMRLPTWDDYLAVAVDEIAATAHSSPSVRRRVLELLERLRASAPASRRGALDRRISAHRAGRRLDITRSR